MSAKTSESMSLQNTVANLIVQKLQPDYTSLRTEIESHEFVLMTTTSQRPPMWTKVLFTTDYDVIIQEVLLVVGATRFLTHKMPLSGWDTHFGEWIDKGHDRYYDVLDSWDQGMGMYGAAV